MSTKKTLGDIAINYGGQPIEFAAQTLHVVQVMMIYAIAGADRDFALWAKEQLLQDSKIH